MDERRLMITHPEQRDLPALKQLWMDTFGDPPALIDTFFDSFSPAVHGWIVKQGDEILSSAYLLLGNQFVDRQYQRSAAYVYAVATPAQHRKNGSAGMLMRHFTNLAQERDLLLYTMPANFSLFHWYAETLKTVPSAPMLTRSLDCRSLTQSASVHPMTAEEYGAKRAFILKQEPHILLSDAFLRLQETYLRMERGGFYSIGDSIFACEMHEDELVIKELLPQSAVTEPLLQSLMHNFSASRVHWTEPAEDGNPLVAFRGKGVSPKTVWGLLLD